MMYYEKELTHHGILGQKWGVRRFQNKDGSYTSAGERRRQQKFEQGEFKRKDISTARKAYKKAANHENYERVSKEYGKKMFNAEKKSLMVGDGDDAIVTRNLAYEGKKAIHEAQLLDAGYSKEKAKKGAEWMAKHDFNITYSDTASMYKEYNTRWQEYDY